MSTRRDGRLRTVLICADPRLGQVVLNSLRANNIRPWLIYDRQTAASTARSSLIAGVLLAADSFLDHEREIVDAINELHQREPLDLVLASDMEGVALLAAARDRIQAPLYPLPSPEALGTLDDKWRFDALCQRLEITTPRTLHYESAGLLDADEIERELGYPAVVKPATASGSIGFRIVRDRDGVDRLASVGDYPYSGLVVQEFVPGQDVGLSIFARDGAVIAEASFICGDRAATECADLPDLREMGRRIVAVTCYSGVANFDGRITPEGRLVLFECNPRFFVRLNALRLCGVDFLELGLGARTVSAASHAIGNYYAPSEILRPSGWKRALSGRWSMGVLCRTWFELVRDPAPPVLHRLGRDAPPKPRRPVSA